MENGEWNGEGLGLVTCPLKEKTTTKIEKSGAGSRKVAKKNRKLGAGGRMTVCSR